MHEHPNRTGRANSDKIAAVVGFDPDDTDAISLLLSLLGWTVIALCELAIAPESVPDLIFYNGKGQTRADIEAVVTAHADQSVLGILLNDHPPFSDFAIADDRVRWLTAPLNIEAVEQVVVSAS